MIGFQLKKKYLRVHGLNPILVGVKERGKRKKSEENLVQILKPTVNYFSFSKNVFTSNWEFYRLKVKKKSLRVHIWNLILVGAKRRGERGNM